MLPRLDRLSLRPAAPIGEFYELSAEEAAELNANGGKDPLTLDQYPANRPRGSDGATFRIFWNESAGLNDPPGHRDEADAAASAARKYAVYDAQMLWDWHSTHPRDPYNAMTISREDWMELYRDYGQNGPIPDFVATLPSYTWPEFGPNTRWVKEKAALGNKYTWVAYDEDGALRFKSKWRPSDQPPTNGLYFEGPMGEERKLRLEMNDPRLGYRMIKHYYGGPGHEYVRKVEIPARGETKYYDHDGMNEKNTYADGLVVHFALYPNRKLLVVKRDAPNGTVTEYELPDRRRPRLLNPKRKVTFPNGDVHQFVGAKDRESLASIFFAGSGNLYEYAGEQGQEHKIRVTGAATGNVLTYEGSRGEEHLVKVTFTNGEVKEYLGPKGAERKVKWSRGGDFIEYEGPKGMERKVKARSAYPGPGKEFVTWFKGPPGQEYMVAEEDDNAPGVIRRYDGTIPGQERLVTIEFPDGTVHHYEGDRRSEKLVWEVTPAGERIERS